MIAHSKRILRLPLPLHQYERIITNEITIAREITYQTLLGVNIVDNYRNQLNTPFINYKTLSFQENQEHKKKKKIANTRM
jgi:hypothetical protein